MNPKLLVSNKVELTAVSGAIHNQLKQQLTMVNPRYDDARKYGRYTGNIPEKLIFYQEHANSLCFPRGYLRKALYVCFQHDINPTIEDHRRVLEPIELSFFGRLRLYQQQAVDAVLRRDDGVLNAPTGSGKTVMANAVIAARKQPTLILVHTKELLYQWRDRIRSFLGIEAGIIGDGKFAIRPVTVGMVQTVRKHLDSLSEHFGQVIVDECHRTPATTFTDCVKGFDARYLLGLSATPFRRDGLTRAIYIYLGDRVYQVDSRHLQRIGAVLRPEIVTVNSDFQYDYRDDYSDMVTALTEDKGRNRLIIQTLKSNQNGGAALVVSDRIAHLKVLANDISGDGIAILTGQTPPGERKRIVDDLAAGKIKILFSTLSLIGEGFDQAGLHDLFIASPIKFQGRLTQVVGRILRPQEGRGSYAKKCAQNHEK